MEIGIVIPQKANLQVLHQAADLVFTEEQGRNCHQGGAVVGDAFEKSSLGRISAGNSGVTNRFISCTALWELGNTSTSAENRQSRRSGRRHPSENTTIKVMAKVRISVPRTKNWSGCFARALGLFCPKAVYTPPWHEQIAPSSTR